MKIENKTFNPMDLSLDLNNPRFLKKLTNEAEMRLYFIEYEDALSVADNLAVYGMLPGDSVVCVIEGGKTIVIEGNRRVSIMQMLLNRDLIPDKYRESMPKVSDNTIEEIKNLNVQIIENRDLAMPVMANRHITGIKQWKPLAKKKFFASRFNGGESIDQLARITNINKSEIANDISDYKFFISNYEKYRADKPSFDPDITDLKIDRFLRIFGTKLDFDGEIVPVKDYLMMERGDDMEYSSKLPDEIFMGFTQHVFGKAFDSNEEESVNTRSTFDDIPDIKEWRSKIDECRDKLPITPHDEAPSTTAPTQTSSATQTSSPVKTSPSGGPPAPKFMEALYWRDKLSSDNRDHLALMRILPELHKMSSGRGKDYVKYPVAAAIIVRSAYEQGLKLLIKTAGLWDDFESRYNNTRNQTLSVLENFVQENNKTILEKDTPLWKSFHTIKRGNYRSFLNDCTHNIDFAYASKDTLEAFAGQGLAGFLQGVVDKVAENDKK